MKILSNIKNDFFKRQEVKLIEESEKNPTYEEAVHIVSKELKSEEGNVVIKLVKGKFGRKTFLIQAYVYDSKEDMDRFEPKKKLKEGAGEKKVEGGEVKEEKKEISSNDSARPPAQDKEEVKVEEKPVEASKEEVKKE
ncbi:MAG: hypothetical protein KKF56_00915 [Nanoarchaeota archaeon]|nr:hypothetical protein [Nanoarchaeota archaeon]